jgi:hypothetical protein
MATENVWAKHGQGQSFTHPDVLAFKAGMSFTVRTLSDTLPIPGWYHQTKSSSGAFLKAACKGSKNGCKMCAANNTGEFAKAKNAEKPYPLKMEFVAPVYVMQTKQVKLLAGKQVWDRISAFGAKYMTLSDAELEITLKDNSGMKEYEVMPDRGKPPLQLPQGTQIPDVNGYLSWLVANEDRVMSVEAVIAMMAAAPAATATPYALPTGAPSFAPPPVASVMPGPAPAPTAPAPYVLPPTSATAPYVLPPTTAGAPAAPAGWGAGLPTTSAPPAPVASQDEEQRKSLQAQFMQMTRIWYEPQYLEKLVEKHGAGRQLEQKTVQELTEMNVEYVQHIATLGDAFVQKLKAAKLIA